MATHIVSWHVKNGNDGSWLSVVNPRTYTREASEALSYPTQALAAADIPTGVNDRPIILVADDPTS